MPWNLSPFAETGVTAGLIECLMGEHERQVRPRLDRLWSYYRNQARPAGHAATLAARTGAVGGVPGLAGSSQLAQACGLPARVHQTDPDGRPREIVIENDIAWRIDTLVDFLFGRPIRIFSTARDAALRERIDAALNEAWEASGGIALLQDMALLGSVYGIADAVVRVTENGPRIELIEAPRGIAVLDPGDYRRLLVYVIVASTVDTRMEQEGMIGRAWRRARFGGESAGAGRRATKRIIDIVSATHRQVYEDGALVLDEPNTLGEIPVVHVQNASQPFRYEGLSDVEPLTPLQDELNTRLSDRAHRVTMQSFNMYLAKGMDFGPSAAGLRVSPGQVWITDNTEAQVEAFGGDGHSPSEDRHIDELREALDKASGVSPVVIGVVRERLGQLSSENALRLTLTGVLNKTMRKRVTYGRGVERASRLMLAAMNAMGNLHTDERDRGVRIEWSEPLPTDERTKLSAALMKRDLGVPAERVLLELGYGPSPANGAGGAD